MAESLLNVGASMSFDARPAGSPTPYTPFGCSPFSEDSTTSKQIATLQAKLNKKLGPEYISQRPGPGGGPKLTYAEGWKIINLANEVFGFNGWSSSIVSIVTDFLDFNDESKRYNVGVTAIMRVTLKDGAYHEDVGYGMLENSKSKAAALDKCKKEAVTDALKRTLRNFGNLLGNCLYDKSYAQEVVKIKVPPAKFDKNELHRRPEFEERAVESSTSHGQAPIPGSSSTMHPEPRVKTEYGANQGETPITYVPRHLRQETTPTTQRAQTPARTPTPYHRAQTHVTASGSSAMAVPANRGPSPATNAPKPNVLATPNQTPARAQRPPPPRAPPPQAVATSPLAQQTTNAPQRSVPSAEPTPAPGTHSADVPAQQSGHAQAPAAPGAVFIQEDDDDDDAFPLSTQDGLLFASVDLDLGDADLGRPIDYEEGTGVLDAADREVLDNAAHARTAIALPDRAGSAGCATGVPAKASVRPEAARGGGFHPAPAAHIAKPVPACVRTSLPPNALKRNADAMQAGSSTRPPVQGMGLAHREHSIANTDHDPKRLKR